MSELDRLEQASWATTVDVYIQISITKILDIDTINQRFQAEAIIESKWHDPGINSMTQSIEEKKVWRPDIYIENAIKDIKEEVNYKVVPFSEQLKTKVGVDSNEANSFMVCEIRKVSGIFYENLELEDFPLDIQDLSIVVASKKPGNIVHFIPLQKDMKSIKISNTLDKSMWKMHNTMITRKDKIRREYSYGKRDYPAIHVSAKVSRLPGFFYWNALLPIFLVSLASLAPFVVDIKFPQSRLPATCTLMLTSVSIRWTIGRLLPTVSYLTSLDKYSLVSMFIITVELLYHGIMGAAFRRIPEDLAYRIDTIAFGIFCAFIFLKQIVFLVWIIRVVLRRKRIHEEEVRKLSEDSDDNTSTKSASIYNLTSINILKERNYTTTSPTTQKSHHEREAMINNQQHVSQMSSEYDNQ